MSLIKPRDILSDLTSTSRLINSEVLYIIYNITDSGDPCGSPSSTLNFSDIKSCRRRSVLRSSRYSSTCRTRYSGQSLVLRVSANHFLCTDGYADFTSRNKPETILPSLHLWWTHEVRITKASSVLCWRLPPICPWARIFRVSAQ